MQLHVKREYRSGLNTQPLGAPVLCARMDDWCEFDRLGVVRQEVQVSAEENVG